MEKYKRVDLLVCKWIAQEGILPPTGVLLGIIPLFCLATTV